MIGMLFFLFFVEFNSTIYVLYYNIPFNKNTIHVDLMACDQDTL